MPIKVLDEVDSVRKHPRLGPAPAAWRRGSHAVQQDQSLFRIKQMVQRAHFRATPKAIAAGMLLLAAACGREPVRTVDASLQPGVRQYLRLAVALGERDPDSLDYFYGPLELVADIRKQPPTFGEIKREADHLISELRSRKSDRSEGDGAASACGSRGS